MREHSGESAATGSLLLGARARKAVTVLMVGLVSEDELRRTVEDLREQLLLLPHIMVLVERLRSVLPGQAGQPVAAPTS